MTNPKLLEGMQSVFAIYWRRGFNIQLVLGDRQFESLRASLLASGIQLNTAAPGEHVPKN